MLAVLNKEKSMKIRSIVQFTKPTYSYLRIIPDKSIKTYNSSIIAKMMASINNSIESRIKKVEKVWQIKSPMKCSYFVDITKYDVKFILIVPVMYENVAKEKIRSVWEKATIEKIDKIDEFSGSHVEYTLEYKMSDALSLDVDKRSNVMINSILNVIDIMDDGDRIGVYYNFTPYSKQAWSTVYAKEISKWKYGDKLDKNKMSVKYVGWCTLNFVMEIMQGVIDGVVEALCDNKSKPNITIIDELRDALNSSGVKLSNATLHKKDNVILNTQIGIMSDSKNSKTAEMNGVAVCQSFNAIAEDNEMVYEKVKGTKKIDVEGYKNKGLKNNRMSVEECYNLIQLPGVETLRSHKIQFVNVLETKVAESLRQGYIYLGESIYKGVAQPAYMSTDDNLANLGLVVLGPQGSGKSVFFSNYANNVAEYGEGMIVIDFIGNCSLSDDIIKTLDKNKVVVIDLTKKWGMQAFAFNEVVNSPDNYGALDGEETTEVDKRRRLANDQAQLLLSFIDSINQDSPLTGRMRRVLSAACNIVFLNDGMALRDVVRCLEDYEARHKFIEKVPEELEEELEEEITTLEEIDECDEDGNTVGTKASKIDFVIDRISLLTEDRKLKHMYKKPLNENVDFVKLMEQGKCIFIKIPETDYPTQAQKNILVTFFICKLWMAAKIRYAMHNGKQLRYHVLLDEIFQAPNCYKQLEDILLQARKFRCKFVFSAHFLNKLGSLKECIKASGSSYMFLPGTDKKNFEAMEEDLAPFVLDDLLNLKRYHSMNMIKCTEGFSKFITKLPPPLSAQNKDVK